MGKIKQINIKNWTYHFFNDMINIKHFNPNLQKTDKKSHKNIDVYYIGYITIKDIGDHESIHSVNPLYFIVGEVHAYIEEKNGNKHLLFASRDKSKELIEKYAELWDKTKSLINKISDKPEDYDEKCK